MSTVRDLVFSGITGDSILNTLGVDANHVWAAGALEGPAPTPFLVLRWGATTKGFGPVNSAPLTINVHDDSGNYDLINAILLRIRTVMIGLSASGVAANWIIDSQWLGDGEESQDDQYKTLMRSCDFSLVANTL